MSADVVESADLRVDLAGLALPNPVMVAAGGAVSGRELAPYLDLDSLGALVTRSVTLDAQPGAPVPRLAETDSGVLHAVGLHNPGLQGFLASELPWLAQRRVRTVVSIAGTSLAEYAELARRVGDSPGVAALEVNLACPDAETGREFGSDGYHAAKVVAVVRRDAPRGVPVLVKLAAGPGLVDVARAVVKAGADALVMIHGLPGMAVDLARRRPALGAGAGQLSGPAIRPVAVDSVWRVHAALPQVPIVGVGGVRSGADALELVAAGATAVQLATAVLADPTAPVRILAEVRELLADLGAGRLLDLVGAAHHHERHP
jgi:dihydroorotate dehydrogenase (NAD+) catalytic subunit